MLGVGEAYRRNPPSEKDRFHLVHYEARADLG
jgi:hypothetical protein